MDKYKSNSVVELLKDILGKLVDIETHLKKYEPKEDTKQLLTEDKTGE